MEIVKATGKTAISIGRQGENLARRVEFDLSEWVSVYGDGVAELIYQRPGDAAPYPVAAVREGSTLVWTVSNLDTAVAATVNSPAHCELRWYVGDVLAKSRTWTVYVDPAMDTPTETAPPEPEQGWVEQVLATGAAVQAATKSAGDSAVAAGNAADAAVEAQGKSETARKGAEEACDRAETAAVMQPYPNAETGTWWTWDADKGAYVDSGEPYEGTTLYATFDVDPATGKLSVYTPARYRGPVFSLNEVTGKLEVTVNG